MSALRWFAGLIDRGWGHPPPEPLERRHGIAGTYDRARAAAVRGSDRPLRIHPPPELLEGFHVVVGALMTGRALQRLSWPDAPEPIAPSGSWEPRRAVARARPGSRAVARLVLAAWFAGTVGCGGAPPAPSGEPSSVASASAPDPRTPIERRRDAACDQLAPRITACAVEDAHADLAAGTIDRRQLEIDTAPGVQRKHTDEFARACKAARYTSRQVRVLEVCFRQEPACPALLDCLGHLQDPDPGAPRRR